MFNFYEFPMQLHFTCRDKQRGEKYLSTAVSPRLPEWVRGSVKQETRAQHVSPFIGNPGTGGAGTRHPGRRRSPTPGAEPEPLPRGSRGCPRRGRFLRPSPGLKTTRETPCAGAGLGPISGRETGGSAVPRAATGPPTSGGFLRGSGRERSPNETQRTARAHLFRGSRFQQIFAKPLHAKKIIYYFFLSTQKQDVGARSRRAAGGGDGCVRAAKRNRNK